MPRQGQRLAPKKCKSARRCNTRCGYLLGCLQSVESIFRLRQDNAHPLRQDHAYPPFYGKSMFSVQSLPAKSTQPFNLP